MALLEDLIRTIRQEDFSDLELAVKLAPLLRHANVNTGAVLNALKGNLTHSENLYCDVVTARFTHDVSQRVSLKRLKQAKSGVVLSCNGAISVATPRVVGSGPNECLITMWFNSTSASNVECTLLLLPEGVGQSEDVAYTASGGSGSLNVTTVDFGAFPGSNQDVVTIPMPAITATDTILCWVLPVATTDHTVADHEYASALIGLTAVITAGVGFDLVASCVDTLEGKFTVGWTISNTSSTVSVAGNYIDKSIVTAKGSMIAATGAGAPVELPVGSNGFALVADSTQSSGVKWSSNVGAWSPASLPLTPNADDEEFSGTAYSGWTIEGTQDSTAIDPEVLFTTANTWRHSWNGIRPGWLMIQPSADLSNCGIYKPLTMADKDFIWTRFSINQSSVSAIDGTVELYSSDGVSRFVYVRWNYLAGAVSMLSDTVAEISVGGTSGVVAASGRPLVLGYMGIRRSGTNYQIWIASDNGSWYKLGTLTSGGTPLGRIGIRARSSGATSPVNPIIGFDFVRRLAGGQLP